MHRLFWKIFAAFWLSLTVFALVTVLAASHYLDRLRQERESESPRALLLRHVDEGQRIADREGLAGLKTWLRRLDRREAVPLLLLDGTGEDLLGRPVPERFVRAIRRFGERPSDRRPWSRPLIRMSDGSEYRLVPDYQSVTLGRVLSRPRVLALPLLVAALVGGLVSVLLARYLTAPIERLRRTTEAYAAGDLAQRVGPSLGTRRDEIADLARAFDHMAQRLHDLIASQRQLLRDVSHELRSPLARLQAALGLARQRVDAGDDPSFERMEREAERLNELIGQLLSLARLESGTALGPWEQADLLEVLQSVVADADFEARAIAKRVELTETTPASVRGLPELLHSALENVVRNAVRYTKEGTAVELSLERDPARAGWLVKVRDHGGGVPEQALPHLFEPFVRVDEARERSTGGYGLGLAIAERAVQLHGGEISARNVADDGLEVAIYLPPAT